MRWHVVLSRCRGMSVTGAAVSFGVASSTAIDVESGFDGEEGV